MSEQLRLSTVFNDLENITVTIAGMVKLSGFTDSAIQYADTALSGRELRGSRFGYLYSICKRYSKEHFEQFDSQRVATLTRQYEVTNDDSCEEEHIQIKEKKKRGAKAWDPSSRNIKRRQQEVDECLKILTGAAFKRQNSTIKMLQDKGLIDDEDIILYNKRQDVLLNPDKYIGYDLYADEHYEKQPVTRLQDAQIAVRSIFDVR